MTDITFGDRKLVHELRDGNVVCEIYEKEVQREGMVRLYHDVSFYRSYEQNGVARREPYIQQRDFDRLHILISNASIWIKRRIYKLNRDAYEDENDSAE